MLFVETMKSYHFVMLARCVIIPQKEEHGIFNTSPSQTASLNVHAWIATSSSPLCPAMLAIQIACIATSRWYITVLSYRTHLSSLMLVSLGQWQKPWSPQSQVECRTTQPRLRHGRNAGADRHDQGRRIVYDRGAAHGLPNQLQAWDARQDLWQVGW